MSNASQLPSMDRLAELQQLIADLASVQRVPLLPNTDRPESDVEHSFGLALTCWYLVPQVAPHLDISKVLRYALSHDIVELHSGDTFVFDAEKVKTKPAREAAALKKLQTEWQDFPELTEYIAGYADKRDAEARFVYAIDKMLPPILTKLQSDQSFFKVHKITKEMHETEKSSKMSVSDEARPYIDLLNAWMAEPDTFYKPGEQA